jgi:hypothetical protein
MLASTTEPAVGALASLSLESVATTTAEPPDVIEDAATEPVKVASPLDIWSVIVSNSDPVRLMRKFCEASDEIVQS